jgi:outer membrane protein assembly factor BamB
MISRVALPLRTVVCGIVALLVGVSLLSAGDWPGWRGPLRTGHTDEVDLPLKWDGKTKDNVLWRVSADHGHSSPIVVGDRVIVTGSVKKDRKDPDNVAARQEHRVTCYRTTDGEKLWQTAIEPGSWDTQFSFTAPTPITDGKQLYAFFGSATLAALDLDGEVLWRKTLDGPSKAEWLSSSPICAPGVVTDNILRQDRSVFLLPASGRVRTVLLV